MVGSSYWFWDTPSWGQAEIWALVFLLVPSILLRRNGKSFLTGLINGVDNRWSTSKASAVLWSYGVLFAFVAILLRTHGSGFDNVGLSDQYLLLLGIPVTAAVSAAAITQDKVEKDPEKKTKEKAPPNPVRGIGQLVSNDAGDPDLLDAQYLAFSVVLLGYFFVQFLSAESATLPTLPGTLVGLAGVSAAGYVAKKGVQKTP